MERGDDVPDAVTKGHNNQGSNGKSSSSLDAAPIQSAKNLLDHDDDEEKMLQEEGPSSSQGSCTDSDDSSFQNAVAVSSALVGESVVDSPRNQKQHHAKQKVIVDTADASFLSHPSLMENGRNDDDGNNRNVDDDNDDNGDPLQSVRAKRNTSSRPTLPQPPLTTDNTNALSVGLMAQGLAWARRQRERRRRLYLQNQAEQQVAKIQEAARVAEQQQQQQQQQTAAGRSLMDNPTFQNLLYSTFGGSSSCSNTTEITAANAASGFAATTTNTAAAAAAANVTDNNGDPEKESTSNDNGDDTMGASTTVSKSGDGISVELDSYATATTMTHYDEDDEFIPPVRVEDLGIVYPNEQTGETTCRQNPFILSLDEMHQIACKVLPRGIVYCRWKRLYSLARDGDSFDACLRLLADDARTLLVVRTSRNAVFGGYADSVWEPFLKGGASYFGSAKACLFKIEPASNGGDGKVKAFHWSGANRYVQLCDPSNRMLAFGGGGDEGEFGLCVEDDFQRGSTGHCATFDNEPLCDERQFKIVNMEVYGFMVGHF